MRRDYCICEVNGPTKMVPCYQCPECGLLRNTAPLDYEVKEVVQQSAPPLPTPEPKKKVRYSFYRDNVLRRTGTCKRKPR